MLLCVSVMVACCKYWTVHEQFLFNNALRHNCASVIFCHWMCQLWVLQLRGAWHGSHRFGSRAEHRMVMCCDRSRPSPRMFRRRLLTLSKNVVRHRHHHHRMPSSHSPGSQCQLLLLQSLPPSSRKWSQKPWRRSASDCRGPQKSCVGQPALKTVVICACWFAHVPMPCSRFSELLTCDILGCRSPKNKLIRWRTELYSTLTGHIKGGLTGLRSFLRMLRIFFARQIHSVRPFSLRISDEKCFYQMHFWEPKIKKTFATSWMWRWEREVEGNDEEGREWIQTQIQWVSRWHCALYKLNLPTYLPPMSKYSG